MTVELLASSPSMGSVFARAALSPLVKRGKAPVLPEQTLHATCSIHPSCGGCTMPAI